MHDYLYSFQTRPKAEADKVLIAAMQDAGVSGTTQVVFKAALDLAGQAALDSNAKAKANGESRILAKFPDSPMISLDDWRRHPDVFVKA